MSIQTPLAKAKGLGSAKEGSAHWWGQRITALALIPLVIWFTAVVVQSAHEGSYLTSILIKPGHALAMILFIATTLYHGMLGMRVVVEDYVQKECCKIMTLIVIQLVTIVTIVASVIAVLAVHLTHLNIGN